MRGSNEAAIKKVRPLVDKIEALEPKFKAMTDDEMHQLTESFRERLKAGETLDDLLPEAYAAVREAAVRTLGQRPFPVQLIGAIVLHQGRIAEMRTGEGKTLTAALPGLPERAHRRGRAHRHRQRLPGPLPLRMDGQDPPLPGPPRWASSSTT